MRYLVILYTTLHSKKDCLLVEACELQPALREVNQSYSIKVNQVQQSKLNKLNSQSTDEEAIARRRHTLYPSLEDHTRTRKGSTGVRGDF